MDRAKDKLAKWLPILILVGMGIFGAIAPYFPKGKPDQIDWSLISVILSTEVAATVSGPPLLLLILQLVSNQFAPRALFSLMRDNWIRNILAIFISGPIALLSFIISTYYSRNFSAPMAHGIAFLSLFSTILGFASFVSIIVKRMNVANLIELISTQTRTEFDRHFCETDKDQLRDLFINTQPPWFNPEPEQSNLGNFDGLPVDVPRNRVRHAWNEHKNLMPIPGVSKDHCIRSPKTGYIQEIRNVIPPVTPPDGVTLLELVFIGHFVHENEPVALIVQDKHKTVDFGKAKRFAITAQKPYREAYVIGAYRSVEQDIQFGFRQLIDIAIKAISPAVNDPTTALNCIDHIFVGLTHMADKPHREHRDKTGIVKHRRLNFEKLFNSACEQILQWGHGDPVILRRLCDHAARFLERKPAAGIRYCSAFDRPAWTLMYHLILAAGALKEKMSLHSPQHTQINSLFAELCVAVIEASPDKLSRTVDSVIKEAYEKVTDALGVYQWYLICRQI